MIAEKSLAGWLVCTSVGTVLALAGSISQQDVVVWTGALSSAGLAGISLYQKVRETKRKEDAADLALTAESDRAKLAVMIEEIAHLRDQLQLTQNEAQRWLSLYQSAIQDQTHGQTPMTGQPSCEK